jgi:hypothetical protein
VAVEQARGAPGCRVAVEQARGAPGCLDFALSADTLDATRVNVFERWQSEADLLAFRGSGPGGDTGARILGADVHRYVISGVEPP